MKTVHELTSEGRKLSNQLHLGSDGKSVRIHGTPEAFKLLGNIFLAQAEGKGNQSDRSKSELKDDIFGDTKDSPSLSLYLECHKDYQNSD